MCRLLYWTGIVLAAIGTAVAIWLLDPSKVLFPGLLTLFSFSLIWTTQDSRLRRENPKMLVFPGSRGLIGNDAEQITICLSNPGVLAGVLTKIDYQVNNKSNSKVTWNWHFLHPTLTPRRNNVDPIGSLPVPLLPGSLIVLHTTTKTDVPEGAFLHLTFRMGGYKERTMKWRVEPLKTAVAAGENKDKTP